MVASTLLFACQDTSAKYLAAFFPVAFLVWARFASNLLLNVVQSSLAGSNAVRDAMQTRQPGLQLLRSAFLVVTAWLYFEGLSELELATALAIFFMYPLVIAMLAPLLLEESLPSKSWAVIAAGIVGMLLIIRPGTPSFEWATLYVVFGTVTFSLFSIVTRRLATTEPIRTTNIYTAVVGTVVMVPSVLLLGGDFEMPTSPWIWALTLSMGFLFGGLGHVTLLHAHKIIPAPELAPWVYVELVWVTVAGYLVFGEVPDALTVLGCAIVCCASLFMLHLEMRVSRRLVEAQTAVPHD